MLKRFKKGCEFMALAVAIMFGAVASAHAEFTVPALPVADLETAGVAVAGLVAAYILIKIVIRMIKGA